MFKLISWLQKEYPQIVKDMQESTHHYGEQHLNPYHLEGSVWTHTMMVCKQAEYMSYEVQIAALLHDIGKPACRTVKHETQRTRFFNHDAVSAFMALEILQRPELELTEEQQTRIFNTIALHTQIYKLTPEQLASSKDVKLVNNLCELGTADHEGRFHSHEGSEIPKSGKLCFLTLKKRIEDLEKDTPKLVTLMCGLPGSGKSTWVDKKENHDCFRVSRDEALMNIAIDKTNNHKITYNEAWNMVDQKEVDKELQRLFKESKEYDKVIVDMTHMSKKSRRRSLSHFGKEYRKECVLILQSLPDVHLTNSERRGKVIGEDVVDRMVKSFYPPLLDEFDDIKYIWR